MPIARCFALSSSISGLGLTGTGMGRLARAAHGRRVSSISTAGSRRSTTGSLRTPTRPAPSSGPAAGQCAKRPSARTGVGSSKTFRQACVWARAIWVRPQKFWVMDIELQPRVTRAEAAAFEQDCCARGPGLAVPLASYQTALFNWLFNRVEHPREDTVPRLHALCRTYSPVVHDASLTEEGRCVGGLALVALPDTLRLRRWCMRRRG